MKYRKKVDLITTKKYELAIQFAGNVYLCH